VIAASGSFGAITTPRHPTSSFACSITSSAMPISRATGARVRSSDGSHSSPASHLPVDRRQPDRERRSGNRATSICSMTPRRRSR